MLVGFAILLALLVLWFDQRGVRSSAACIARGRAAWLLDVFALLIIVAAFYPLRALFEAWSALAGHLPADARTHALVARQLYGESLLSGWTDRYVGGFPLALHYPIVGWLVIGLPMKLGMEPTRAVTISCTIALMTTSLIVYAIGRINGVRVLPSATGALVLAWVSPLNSFVGGYESFVVTGLVSQVMVMPTLLLWLALAIGRGSVVWAAFFAALSFLTHPQVAICAALILCLGVVAMARRALAVRASISIGFALLVAALVYGPAMADFSVPFGWPRSYPWMRLGFGPERLHAWLVDGDLLDNRRPPVLTALWAASSLLSVGRWRSPAARAVLVVSLATLFGCVVGPPIASSGAMGSRLLAVVQPLRMLALVPVAAATTTLVALQLYWDVFEGLLERVTNVLRLPSTLRGWLPGLGLSSILAFPVAFVLQDSRQTFIRHLVADLNDSSAKWPCGSVGPSPAEWEQLRGVLSLLEGGRLWFDDGEDTILSRCAQIAGLERYSRPAIANTNAVGAHVGVLKLANDSLFPGQQGWSERAEALGIRYVLLNAALDDDARESFRLQGTFGPLHLYVRSSGFDLFGPGCIDERWNGQNRALESALAQAMRERDGSAEPLNPRRWIALEPSARVLTRSPVADACDSSRARLDGETHSIAYHQASVTTEVATDLVLRVTASPTWHLFVDGAPVAAQLVAPGYLAVRLAPGTHRVQARHGYRPVTLFGFGLVLLCPLLWLLSWRRSRAVPTKDS